MRSNDDRREAKKGSGDEIPRRVWAAAQRNPCAKRQSAGIGEGPKPAAASGGNRQAKRRESQGAAYGCDYASSPGAEGDNYDSDILR